MWEDTVSGLCGRNRGNRIPSWWRGVRKGRIKDDSKVLASSWMEVWFTEMENTGEETDFKGRIKYFVGARYCSKYFTWIISMLIIALQEQLCPGWCGSVDWAPAYKPKGRQFDSQSGHMPGLWAMSLVGGAQGATTHWWFSPSLSPSLPLCWKINKILKKKQTVVFLHKGGNWGCIYICLGEFQKLTHQPTNSLSVLPRLHPFNPEHLKECPCNWGETL